MRETELDRFLKLFAFRKGDYFKTITYIVPRRDLWSRADTARFKQMITRKLQENGINEARYDLTGANLLTGDLKELIIENLKSSLWLAGLSIVVVLLIYYRSLKSLVLSTLPYMMGLAVLSGVMVVFGLDFNFLNLIVIPMIVGIGIDDGVHFTNAFRQLDRFDRPAPRKPRPEGRGRGELYKNGLLPYREAPPGRAGRLHMSKAMSQTGRAVVLTSLTTMVGFGSISLSHYPGLRSMGYVAIIGISACLFATIIVLPAIFAIIRHTNPNVAKVEDAADPRRQG